VGEVETNNGKAETHINIFDWRALVNLLKWQWKVYEGVEIRKRI